MAAESGHLHVPKGAFVPEVYYNIQVAQSVTISNEDMKCDIITAWLIGSTKVKTIVVSLFFVL